MGGMEGFAIVATPIFAVFCLIANLVSLIVWQRGQACKNIPYARYFSNLSLVDLLAVLIVTPTRYAHIFGANSFTINDIVCPLLRYGIYIIDLMSCFIMTCLILDRALSALFPQKVKLGDTMRRSCVVSIVLLVVFAVYRIPDLIFNRIVGYPQYVPDYDIHMNYNVEINYTSYPREPPPVIYACHYIGEWGTGVEQLLFWTEFILFKVIPPLVFVFSVVVLVKKLCDHADVTNDVTDGVPARVNRRITQVVLVIACLFATASFLDTLMTFVWYDIYMVFTQMYNLINALSCCVYFAFPEFRHDVNSIFRLCSRQTRRNGHDITEARDQELSLSKTTQGGV